VERKRKRKRGKEKMEDQTGRGRGGLVSSYGSSYIITLSASTSSAPSSPKMYPVDHDYVATTPRLGEPLAGDASTRPRAYHEKATTPPPAAARPQDASSGYNHNFGDYHRDDKERTDMKKQADADAGVATHNNAVPQPLRPVPLGRSRLRSALHGASSSSSTRASTSTSTSTSTTTSTPEAQPQPQPQPQPLTPQDEAERVLEEVRRLVAAEKDEALLLQLCAHHLAGAGGGTGLREALIHAAVAADLPRRLSLLAALQAKRYTALDCCQLLLSCSLCDRCCVVCIVCVVCRVCRVCRVCGTQRKVELSRAWNERFQRVLQEPDSVAKFKKLSNLAQNFVFTAEQVRGSLEATPVEMSHELIGVCAIFRAQYGRIIIEEYYLPLHQKTLKPGATIPLHRLWTHHTDY
jgi:hypothetical protein